VVVIGACEYGVLARPGQTPFLLRHYPKAMAGSPDELNRMRPRPEVPLEIVATADGERLILTALRAGRPVPGAVFHTVDADLLNDEVTADRDGKATWKPPSRGYYAVYTNQTLPESGEVGGKKYAEIREFATLAFSWPLARTGADPKAVALFQEALAARAQWKGFPGFTALATGKMDGRPFEARVTVDGDGKVRVETEEKVVQPWLKEQLESIVLHRSAGSAGEQPAPVLRFADDETDHPFGRLLLFEGGRFASSYRVKDRQILVVNRLGSKLNMTITVLDNERNPDGQFLPHSYTVQYWDAASGELRRTEAVQQRWQRVGSWDLPARHTVTTATAEGLSVRSFTLAKHETLPWK
jgi:hypothetical protein